MSDAPPKYQDAQKGQNILPVESFVEGTIYLNFFINASDVSTSTGTSTLPSRSPSTNQAPAPFKEPEEIAFCDLVHVFEEDYQKLHELVSECRLVTANLRQTADAIFTTEDKWKNEGRRRDLVDIIRPVVDSRPVFLE